MKLITAINVFEGITHLEDADVHTFIKALKNLSKFIATEKLDGYNLRFGLDNNGKFYTSREGKGKKDLFYSTSDYENTPAQNSFKAAHAAIQKQLPVIKQVIGPGEAAEVEVLFGRQPNAITYGLGGHNYISMLRMVNGTDDSIKPDQKKIGHLTDALTTKTSTVKTKMLDTIDGTDLQEVPVTLQWKFVKPQQIDTKHLLNVDFKDDLDKLEKFLNTKNKEAAKAGLNLTNGQLLSQSLTSVDKNFRDIVKTERDRVTAKVLSDFKIPIKEKILDNVLRKLKPPLQDANVTSDEDIGVEGIVLLNPETLDQLKIVDKDVFTALNMFNFAVRNKIFGVIKTSDPKADLENRGGIFGDAMIRIAGLFNEPDLGKSSTMKKVFRKVKGADINETVTNFANNLKTLNYLDAKKKIIAIFEFTDKEIRKELDKFKKDHPEFKLQLKNGKTIGYTQEVVRRTLVSFAETLKRIKDVISEVKKAKSMEQIIYSLYSRQIDSIHDEENVKEGLISENKNEDRRDELKEMTAIQIADAYTANLLAALLLLKAGCPKIKALLSDTKYASLLKFNKDMSVLNYWGLVAFYPENKDVKSYLRPEVYKSVWKTAGRILTTRIKSIHKDLSSPSKLSNINWETQKNNMRVITLRFDNRTQSINRIREGIYGWDELDANGKSDVLHDAYIFLLGADPFSPFNKLLRDLANKTLLSANKEDMKLVKQVNDLSEEDGGTGAGDIGGVEGGTTNGSSSPVPTLPGEEAVTTGGTIGNVPFKLFKGKIIKRVKRNDWKKVNTKFMRPTKEKK